MHLHQYIGNMMGWFSGLVIGDVYYELITNPENQRKTLRNSQEKQQGFRAMNI